MPNKKNVTFEDGFIEFEDSSSPATSQESNSGGEEEEDEELEESNAEESDSGEHPSDSEAANHPYPTPPPDEGSKLPNGKEKSKQKTKGSVLSLATMAIEKLASRSGSSVKAIIKYLKSEGYQWDEEKRFSRLLTSALKKGVANGQFEQVKMSFKISEQAKKTSKAVEKMKAKKQKEKEAAKDKEMKAKKKEMEKEKKKKAKEAEKERAKVTKAKEKQHPAKKTERKTKQPSKKAMAQEGANTAPPKAKGAALEAIQAVLETPKSAPPAPRSKTARSKVEVSSAGKSKKKPRKSIGSLAQTKSSKPSVKAVKKLVSAKAPHEADESTANIVDAQATSTPQVAPPKGKRMRKV
ncbi:uncharacterized protein Dana_GF18591 [Drosophila ananassae]|uniref:CG3509-PA n=1 Tax=Drosophila ananassae TaxID=7217 RepID=B3LVA7_DROAN|nr:histone H1, gonadal [Drosophila ananassae]EDV43639.1 uncharacterized protein Dana_GF18591 [Drosophila ananassae]CBE66834.1 CG3509-PA [Drosophila ananassae]CBE66835.1 CG3509-PA [Drosophila ananassae]CBE66840.1 CG3509-PA [Drosophila ananassae]